MEKNPQSAMPTNNDTAQTVCNHTEMTAPPSRPQRLLSLDVMRGLDMFFLVVIGPILTTWQRIWGLPAWLNTQLRHVDWEGLTAWDLIMPWFIFMCGAAIPFALPKRLKNGRAGWNYWSHVLGRVSLLWLLGMIVQGNLLSLNPSMISPYNNTLQTIAAGYLIAALLLLIRNRTIRYLIPLLLAAVYGMTLALFGDYTPQGNIAVRIEQWLLPMNRDGYSWVLTTPMFGVMTLCGMFCTEVLRNKCSAARKIFSLLLLGIGLLFGGMLLGCWEPAIKRIYTVSFTFQALGWGVLMLTVLYFVIDVCRIKRGWGLLSLYGRRALTAYLCRTLFWHPLNVLAQTLTYGMTYWIGAKRYPLVQVSFATLLLTLLLYFRDRRNRKHP